MNMTLLYKRYLRRSFGLVILLLAGCGPVSESHQQTSDENALQGFLVARAHSVSAATSALESIDRGEIEVARSTLEAEVTSGLAVLRTAGAEARKADAQLIADVIDQAESYAKRKNLKVILPDSE
jgi:hypothetical protein